MKSSKLIEIFKQGNMVIPLYLLQHFKDLKLKLEEFIFLMYLYNLGDNFVFDPTKFSNDLNMTLVEVMSFIEVLTDKKFIRVESKKNDKVIMEEFIIMDDFYSKLTLITIDEVNKETNDASKSDIFEVIQKEFGRTISPIEYEIIKAWIESGINESVIKEAVKEATFNGVSNLRYIDKILYEWGKLGVKTVEDVEKNRMKRNNTNKNQVNEEVDMDVIEWNWFDDDE